MKKNAGRASWDQNALAIVRGNMYYNKYGLWPHFFLPHLKSVAYNYQKPHFYGVGFSNAYKATLAKCGHRTKRPCFRAAAYLEQDEYTYTINRPHLLIVPNIFYLGYTLKMGL